jgi:hypothetical protein
MNQDKRIRVLLDEISNMLDANKSLESILGNAVTLAVLTDDIEYKKLFELHIDGFDRSRKWSGPVKKWPSGRLSKWDVVDAFFSDRKEMQGENIQTHSLSHLEFLFNKIRDLSSDASNSDALIQEASISNVLGKIRSRVLQFLHAVEEDLLRREKKQDHKQLRKTVGTKIFIGHGRSSVWMTLKDFLMERLSLSCVEFNSETPAGKSTKERLEEMMKDSCFAFLIMTGHTQIIRCMQGKM